MDAHRESVIIQRDNRCVVAHVKTPLNIAEWRRGNSIGSYPVDRRFESGLRNQNMYQTRQKQIGANMSMFDFSGKCGCGGDLRYSHKMEDGTERMSCNKYAVCLTWEQQHNRLREIAIENAMLKEALEKIVAVNACDYEYRAWAKEAMQKLEIQRKKAQ